MTPEERRIVVQSLESLARAGLTHLPVARTALVPENSIPRVEPVKQPSSEPTPHRVAAHGAIALQDGRVAGDASVPQNPAPIRPPAPMPVPKTTSARATSPPDDRRAALKVIADTVAACTRCEELARTRTQTVFGVGDPHAKIVFIGEAPGADEDREGEPFVGRAGQLLNDIIKASKLVREELYICNILRCRPPGNRTPAPDECANCREYLLGQLAIIDPDYIVCWGAVAAKNLLQTEVAIGKLRGKLHDYGRAKVLCTYHPSYLLRNPAAKKDVWEDMKFFRAHMGVDLTKKE